jgi:hypothetical protein
MAQYRGALSESYDWQLSVADRLAAPAGGEAKGTRYLITVGSGDFTGYNNYIATAKQANPSAPAHWYFDAPLEGMATYVKDEDKCYQYITSWNELRISCLFDADMDTGIEVEQSADEDKIRFKTAGTERLSLDSVGLLELTGSMKITSISPTFTFNDTDHDIYQLYINSGEFHIYNVTDTKYRFSIDTDGNVGINKTTPTARLHVVVADTNNIEGFLVEQLDTTNNPICAEINNDGTNHGLYIHQDGVLATSKYGLYIYSNAAQVNIGTYLLLVQQANASSTKGVVWIINAGTSQGLLLTQDGNGIAQEIGNSGTQHGLYLHQDGVLDASKYGLYVYSNAAQINSLLLYVRQDHASSTADLANITNDGTGTALYISQIGTLAVDKHGLYVYSGVAQTSDYDLVRFFLDSPSSTQRVLLIRNDGTGQGFYIQQEGNGIGQEIGNNGTNHGLYIHQDGVLAGGKPCLYIYSDAAQVNSYLLYLHQDNASSTAHVAYFNNDGTGHCLYLAQNGVLDSARNGLYVYSNAVQVNSSLVFFAQDNASSTAVVMELDNDGTGHGLYIHQDGNLATGKYALYIDNNGTPADGAGRCIRLDGCTITSTKSPETDTEAGFIAVNIDGTQYAIPFYALS